MTAWMFLFVFACGGLLGGALVYLFLNNSDRRTAHFWQEEYEQVVTALREVLAGRSVPQIRFYAGQHWMISSSTKRHDKPWEIYSFPGEDN